MADPARAGPGRACPVDSRYGERALAGPATLCADTLWIAGGLYGNSFALSSLEALYAEERGESALLFNGDFHWFDIDAAMFSAIDRGVAVHAATRGNVETELAQPQAGAGCGCGYPDWVGDEDVERSNRIMERLKETAGRVPGTAERLVALPMYRIAEAGGVRIAIVHGDADSLAGWKFSQEHLATPQGRDDARRALLAANVSVFASSHTCLPVLQAIGEAGLIVNNGSAGMPNFAGTSYGLATRIALTPHPKALYRARSGPLHVEAIPIEFDAPAWRAAFLAQWPHGSDAHASYFERIAKGPRYDVNDAVRDTATRR